jgi:hypothetical protein
MGGKHLIDFPESWLSLKLEVWKFISSRMIFETEGEKTKHWFQLG